MLIEFFEDADYTFGSPIVLIWGREPEAVAALLTAFRSLAEAQGREVALHVEVPGVQAVGCQVFAVNRQATWLHPEGVYALKAKGTFSWCRDSEGWLEVADKVESFLAGISAGQTNIYQDLSVSKDAAVILSAERAW